MDFSRQEEAKEIISKAFERLGKPTIEEYFNVVLDTSNPKGCNWFATEIIKAYDFYYMGMGWGAKTLQDLALVNMVEFLLGVELQDEYERRLKERFNIPPLQ